MTARSPLNRLITAGGPTGLLASATDGRHFAVSEGAERRPTAEGGREALRDAAIRFVAMTGAGAALSAGQAAQTRLLIGRPSCRRGRPPPLGVPSHAAGLQLNCKVLSRRPRFRLSRYSLLARSLPTIGA